MLVRTFLYRPRCFRNSPATRSALRPKRVTLRATQGFAPTGLRELIYQEVGPNEKIKRGQIKLTESSAFLSWGSRCRPQSKLSPVRCASWRVGLSGAPARAKLRHSTEHPLPNDGAIDASAAHGPEPAVPPWVRRSCVPRAEADPYNTISAVPRALT